MDSNELNNMIATVQQIQTTVFGSIVPEIKVLNFKNEQLQSRIRELEEQNKRLFDKLIDKL